LELGIPHLGKKLGTWSTRSVQSDRCRRR